jgi:uncharacterized SAM-binding protein YcdF (DUF218 family)
MRLFYLEKILSSIFTPPGLVILILLILALTLLRKKDARGIRAAGIVLLVLSIFGYLLSTGLGTYLYLRPLEKEYPVPKSVGGQVIVVLSSGVIITPAGQVLDNHSVARLSGALNLHLQTKLPIIVTGSFVPGRNTLPVAELMRDWLLGQGVGTSRILVEPQARNTWENAEYTARLCSQSGWKSVILVTSAVHMKRAVKSFEKFGLIVTPYPTDYLYDHTDFGFVDILPSRDALNANLAAIHEFFGQIRYTFKNP